MVFSSISKYFLLTLILFIELWVPAIGIAQEGVVYPDRNNLYFGASMGPLLPFKIDGMTETYPTWGMWLSHPSEISQVEYGFLAAHAKGVSFYNLSIGLRIDYELAKALQAYLTLGIDGNYYRPQDTLTNTYDFDFSGGSHFGFGVLQRMALDLYLRADCKFSFGPGKTLYTGFGFLWEIGMVQPAGSSR